MKYIGAKDGFVRAPFIIEGILIGLMWRWMYDGNYGVLNDILQKLHILNKKNLCRMYDTTQIHKKYLAFLSKSILLFG